MAMEFTENQKKAIELNDRNILVSAAAGSGKTRVLVERIIRKVTDENESVDIDRLLVMTFTNAAAKEMRDRIRAELDKRLRANPDNENYLRQSVLVHNAQITTIHGFCQNIIREHFEELSIDPNFRVADENECRLLKQDVINEVLEAYYEEGAESFLETVEKLSTGKSDTGLADMILKLYDFSQSSPSPIEFLDNCIRPFEVQTVEELESQPYLAEYIAIVKKKVDSCISLARKAIEIIDDTPELIKYRDTLASDLDSLMALKELDTYEEFRNRVKNYTFEKIASVRLKDADDDVIVAKESVSGIRNSIKTKIGKDIKDSFAFDINQVFEHMRCCKSVVTSLINITKSFNDEYSKKKASRNIIDFNDMEHMAIRILTDNPEITRNYSDNFKEIYVDEYQDSNMTQETLINLIRDKSENTGNLFMVGDVKQSIYRFRQARPDLFLEKYNKFSEEESVNQKVILSDNFRSRKEVINAVNEIFKVIMHSDLGGIEYDDNAALKYGAKYYDDADENLHIGDSKKIYKAELLVGIGDELPRIEYEAQITATKIRQMIDGKMPVYDTKLGTIRDIQYKDIVILVRSLKGWDKQLKAACEDNGIPVSVNATEGYFKTMEVQTILSFLSVIDNPLQDIPLANVCTSPIGDFDNVDLAVIRSQGKKEELYSSILRIINSQADSSAEGKLVLEVTDELRNKCQALVDKIDYYREKSKYTPVYQIIQEIVDSGYGEYVKGMAKGEQRMANLAMLCVKAEDYSRTSFVGLFNFVRYMELIRKYEIEDGEAGLLGEEDNVVKIMTIHKSKGLEFPVCICVGVDKKRNMMDESGDIIWDASYGIGINSVNLERRTKVSTLYKNVVAAHMSEENAAEELRVLYVAMTRAREKLILVGWNSNEELFSAKKADIYSCVSFQDLILYAEDKLGSLMHIDISKVSVEELVGERVRSELSVENAKDQLLELLRNDDYSAYMTKEEFEDRVSRFNFVYPHMVKSEIPSKLSVSELKHMAIEEESARGAQLVPDGEVLFAETSPDKYIPDFMREEGETVSGGTFYGTAFHRILELWSYNKADVSAEDVAEFVALMRDKKRMSKEQADAIRCDDIAFFLNSDLGKRMYEASRNNNLFREQPFVIGVSRKEIVPSEDGDELILVQGIVDAYIEEDDGISIIDYKTDYVTQEQMLVTRYRAQLEYYDKALSQITGKKVKELIIYSSRLRKSIVL